MYFEGVLVCKRVDGEIANTRRRGNLFLLHSPLLLATSGSTLSTRPLFGPLLAVSQTFLVTVLNGWCFE